MSATRRSEILGVALTTVTFALIEPAEKPDVAACDAVMVTEPAPMIDTLPSRSPTVATLSSLDLNVIAPVEFDLGAAMSKAASPKVFVTSANSESVGAVDATTTLKVVDAPSQSVLPACDAVTVTVPADLMVALVPVIATMLASDDEYVNVPLLGEVGFGKSKSASRNAFETSAGAVKSGVPLRTVTTSESVAEMKSSVDACATVIVALPAPPITQRPVVFDCLITSSSLLVNVKAPFEFEVGFAIANESSPKVLVMSFNAEFSGVAFPTMSVEVIVPASKPRAAACVAVITVVPAPTIVTRPVVALTVATSGLLDEYLNPPGLFESGGSRVKGSSPNVLVATRKLESVGFSIVPTVVWVAPAAETERGTVVDPNVALRVCTVDGVSPFGTVVLAPDATSFAPAAEGTVVVGAT